MGDRGRLTAGGGEAVDCLAVGERSAKVQGMQ